MPKYNAIIPAVEALASGFGVKVYTRPGSVVFWVEQNGRVIGDPLDLDLKLADDSSVTLGGNADLAGIMACVADSIEFVAEQAKRVQKRWARKVQVTL